MKTQAQKRREQDKLEFTCSLDRDDKWYSYWVNNYNYIIRLLGEIKKRQLKIEKSIEEWDADEGLRMVEEVIAEMQKVNE